MRWKTPYNIITGPYLGLRSFCVSQNMKFENPAYKILTVSRPVFSLWIASVLHLWMACPVFWAVDFEVPSCHVHLVLLGIQWSVLPHSSLLWVATCLFYLLSRIVLPNSDGVWLCLYIERKANSHKIMSHESDCQRSYSRASLHPTSEHVTLRKWSTIAASFLKDGHPRVTETHFLCLSVQLFIKVTLKTVSFS